MPNTTIGSYEAHCNDYAVNGDPMADHYRYEENAGYDRWDGHREESDYAHEYDNEVQEHEFDFNNRTDHMTDEHYADCREIDALASGWEG